MNEKNNNCVYCNMMPGKIWVDRSGFYFIYLCIYLSTLMHNFAFPAYILHL